MILGGCLLFTGVFGACKDTPADNSSNSSPQNTSSPVQNQTYGLSEVEISVEIDEKFTLEIISDGEITESAKWESENVGVALVDVNGVVTGKSLGTTRIFAKIGGKQLVAVVKVVENLEVIPQLTLKNEFAQEGKYTFNLLEGGSYTLTPALVADTEIEGVTFTVSSANNAVAIEGCTLTGVSEATDVEIQITCEYEGKTYTLTAFVNVRKGG